jgi:membrane fusion protein, multidrug efflux system
VIERDAVRRARTVVGLAGIAACCVVAGCRKAPARGFGGFPPAQVGVVTVTPHDVPMPYEIVGQVEPFRRVEVRSRVEGVIVERPFVEGSMVRPGELLFRLDSVRYRAAYDAAVATYANAARTLARMNALLPRHAVAQQDVDNARTAVDAAKAALDQAQKDLSDTRITAEIAGRVGRAQLQLGARVTGPNDILTTIDQLDPVYVTFRPSSEQVLAWRADPTDRALIRPGSALRIRVVHADSSVAPEVGRLDFVAPGLDSATGTQEFRARFSNANGALVPGAFVRVRLDGFMQRNAITVPQRAVQQGLGRQYVLVVGHGDTVATRDIVPGPWTGFSWVIDSGLVAGDRVIVDGVQKAIPGMVVKPSPVADSTGAAPPGRAGGARP